MRVTTITQHFCYLDDNEKWTVEYSENGRNYRFIASMIQPYSTGCFNVSGPALNAKGEPLSVNRTRLMDAKNIPADILKDIPTD